MTFQVTADTLLMISCICCSRRQVIADDLIYVLQKGKGKAGSASQPLQPQLSQSTAEVDHADADGIQLKTDIAVTTGLLAKFNAFSDTWEALEVRSILASKLHA